jgi:hypothetical protein
MLGAARIITAMTKQKNAGAKYFGQPLSDDPDDAPELLDDFFRQRRVAAGRQ